MAEAVLALEELGAHHAVQDARVTPLELGDRRQVVLLHAQQVLQAGKVLGGVVGQAGKTDGLNVLPVSLRQVAGDLLHPLAVFLEPGAGGVGSGGGCDHGRGRRFRWWSWTLPLRGREAYAGG